MEIYVSPKGSDSNKGTIELPLKTVACAARLAVACSNAGEAVTVWIAAGTYAESILIIDSPASGTAPIVFEAIEKGAVIITGAGKCIKGWSESGLPGIWRHRWEEAWGPGEDVWAEYAESCPHAAMAPIVRRREMLFVNQVACRRVLSVEELQPGSFLIDEDQSQILLQPEPGVILEQSDIEIGKRGSLFSIEGRSNITLRGLTFCKACNYIPDGTVQAKKASKINIENCMVHSNNGDGICLYECHDVTLSNVTSSNNGFSGIIFYKVNNARLSGVITSQNNWRGISGGFDYWSTSGMKACMYTILR